MVAGINGCAYCAAAHTAISQRMSVDAADAARWLAGEAADARLAAILAFVAEVVRARGHVSDARVAALRQAGLSDADILEVTAHIALNTLTNYVNHIAGTEVDFPAVALPRHGAAA